MERDPSLLVQRGLTLIEVMVALAILAIGLSGLSALMTHSLHGQQQARHQTQALLLATDLHARLRATPAMTLAFDREASVGSGGPDCYSGPCSPGALAASTEAEWLALVARQLPQAHARLAPAGDGWQLRLRWHATPDAVPEGDDCPRINCLERDLAP